MSIEHACPHFVYIDPFRHHHKGVIAMQATLDTGICDTRLSSCTTAMFHSIHAYSQPSTLCDIDCFSFEIHYMNR